MSVATSQIHSWTHPTKPGLTISTDPSLIPLASLNAALASSDLYWAVPLPEPELRLMIDSSVCFGLYSSHTQSDSSTSSLIGFARLVTDRVTFVYLTDVYVLPEYQKQGLSTWMMDCVGEWVELMPNLRQFTLVTGSGKAAYYAAKFGTRKFEDYGRDVNMYMKKGPKGVAFQ